MPKTQPAVMRFAIVQACDGRYNYGPAVCAQAMKYDEHGTYPTPEAAMSAAIRDVVGEALALQ